MKMILKIMRISPCFLILLLFSIQIYGQNTGGRVWLGIQAKKDIGKKLDAYLEFQERLTDYGLEQERFLIETGIEKDLFSFIELAGGYRFIFDKEKNGNYRVKYRLNLDVSASYDLDRYTIKYRTRIQNGAPDIIITDTDNVKWYNRNMFQISYNIYRTPFEPKAGFEFFYSLFEYTGNKIDKLRYNAEVDIILSDMHIVNVFYMYEQEINNDRPEYSNIFGLKYKIRW